MDNTDFRDESNETKTTKSKNPVIFAVLKTLGFVLFVVAIVFFVISRLNFGNFDSNWFMTGGVLGGICFVLGFISLGIGFAPQIAKLNIKLSKHIQEQNKDDLAQIASTNAVLSQDAIKKTASAVKRGIDEECAGKFCCQCGKKIASDAKFCSHCGAEQEKLQ